MIVLLTILIAVVSVLLILVVLIQNPKGGGLDSAFGGTKTANQILGAANSTDVLEKVTWGLAGALMVLCLATGVFFKPTKTGPVDNTSVNTEEFTNNANPNPLDQGGGN